MRYRSVIAISASSLLAASLLVTTTTSSAQPQDASKKDGSSYAGSFAIGGEQAAAYTVPGDVRQVWSHSLPGGLTQTRYQQYVGNASVFGGQVTVIEDAAGTKQSVIGAHFPGLAAVNDKDLTKGKARNVVEGKIGARGDWDNTLRIDPRSGRLFFEVEAIRDASRPERWVNADNGNVIKSFEARAPRVGHGGNK